jgi:hypothetical protein
MGKPKNVWRFFFFGCGFGSSSWQRQQTSLSSGFHVLQFGQSICIISLLADLLCMVA